MSFEGIKKHINVPMLGFCLFAARFIMTGFDLASAVASFAFASMYCFETWARLNAKPDSTKELAEKVQQLENQISVIKLNNGIRTVVSEDKRRL